MNNKYLLILVTLLFGLTAKSQTTETVDEYYSSAQDKTRNELKAALHAKISVHTVLSYSQVWEALKTTDQDPNNSDNVILLYTGWSYPKTNNASGNSLNTT